MSEAALKMYPDHGAASATSRPSQPSIASPFAAPDGSAAISSDTVRRICELRRKREEFFSAKLFGDPTWEILLRLYIAHLDGSRLSISRLNRSSRVALTTLLRRLAVLEKEGLVTRSEDPFDGRRVYVGLSFAGASTMDRCFAATASRAQFLQGRAAAMTVTERDYWLHRYEAAVANAATAAGERSRAAYLDLAHHYWSMHMMVLGRPTSTPAPQAIAEANAAFERWAAQMEQGGRKCVYVIDDDPQVLDSTAFLLSALGYKCITFGAADEFLERAVELPSGCVLTDLRMPGTDGLELTRKFKDLGFNWPIVLMTSDSAGDRAALAAAHGITTVLSKPVEADLMGDALADAFKTLHG